MPKRTDSKPYQSEAPAGIGVWIGTAFVLGMFGMVAGMGLLTFYAGLRLLVTGEQHWGVALLVTAMGVVFSGIGLGFFYFRYFKEPVLRARQQALEARYPDQPWMLRSDWAARKVTDSNLGVVIFMWVWVTGWWSAILFIWSMNRDKILAAIAASWQDAAFGLIFLLAGLIGLLVAVHMTRSWWRYGRSTLRIDTLPGYLGEQFRGSLEASFRVRPTRLEADLSCEEVTWVTRRRNGKTERECVSETLWSATHALEPSRMQLAGAAGGQDRLPIVVPLPANQPPCKLDEVGDGIVWRLTVREVREEAARPAYARGRAARTDGPPFSASFEVPVFRR